MHATFHRARRALAVAAAGSATALSLPSVVAAASVPPPLSCYQPTAPYAYGATDANAETGNGSLTAVFDAAGTLTVLRALAADEDNQVDYFASGYDQRTGAAVASAPNNGLLVGLRYTTGAVSHFSWLRDLPHSQADASDRAPVVTTSYAGPAGSGLTVTDTAFATAGPLHLLWDALDPSGADALVQDLEVQRSPGSPADDVELVGYGDWNPTAQQVPYIPLADSGCSEDVNAGRAAAYDRTDRAAVSWWHGVDASSGRPAGAAVAMGWSSGTDAWQVGGDSSDPATLPTEPADGFQELTKAPYRLGDSSSTIGQTTTAVMARVAFGPGGIGELRLLTTAGADPQQALTQLVRARVESAASARAAVETAWSRLLARAPVPEGADRRTTFVARRSLITALLAVDPQSGAVVASPDTQGPYGEDWVRDGSFIDHMLDMNGYHDLVTRHELFYARTQSTPTHPVPTVPVGNWPMVMYPSGGGVGGPIPYEIDETGYGAWTLWDHATFLPAPAAISYLRLVFPALARAADWLTICADPRNNLQCPANEDDNYAPSQTLHGALPDLLGLRSALAAARALGLRSPQVSAWQRRADLLAGAIGALYDPSTGAYRESPGARRALPVGFEDGGLLLWPTQLLPYASPPMQSEASATLSALDASFSGATGAYEAVALLGVCRARSPLDSGARQVLVEGLNEIDRTTSTDTGLFGEFWRRWGDGHVGPMNDMPHTWEGALFDMAALCVYGTG